MPIVRNLEALMRGCRRVGAPRVRRRKAVDDPSRRKRSNEVAEPVGDEVDETLRGGPDFFARTLIGVYLPAHEEEIVADAVKEDAQINQRHYRPVGTHSECEIP